MQTYLKFNSPKDSQEFKILSLQASLHVTARQKNIQLLKVVASKSVAFKDIKSHLMNEAKRCGLWEKGVLEDHYKSRAWYVAANNFVIWTKKNYSDYNVQKNKVVIVTPVVKEDVRQIVVRHEVKPIVANKMVMVDPKPVLAAAKKLAASQGATDTVKVESEQGEIARLKALLAAQELLKSNDDSTDIIKQTPANILPLGVATVVGPASTEGKSDSINASLKPSVAINRPLEECLTIIQIQTIIFKNLSILGKKASELGAADEFNLLMEKMGLQDEMLDLSGDLLPLNPIAQDVVAVQ